MIFLCGIPSEPSLGLVIDQLVKLQAPHIVFNQRRFAEMEIEFAVSDHGVTGVMALNGERVRLEEITAVYTRLMDFRLLPEITHESEQSPSWRQCHAVHTALSQWYEIAPSRVLNRMQEIGLNYAKPFQAQLIRAFGFSVPETLVTNDPELVAAFRAKHGRVIYKSVSAVRSIVSLLEDDDLHRLEAVRACPTQFQQYIEGDNVRVHTIGERAFATAVTTSAVDYRYAYMNGQQERLEAVALSHDLEGKCLELSTAFGLDFAGVDLKVTPDGEVYCLEVNPCPAFSYYELHTGQAISQAVAEYLLTSDHQPAGSDPLAVESGS